MVLSQASPRPVMGRLSLLREIQCLLPILRIYPGIRPPLDLSNAQISTIKTVNFGLGDLVTQSFEFGW